MRVQWDSVQSWGVQLAARRWSWTEASRRRSMRLTWRVPPKLPTFWLLHTPTAELTELTFSSCELNIQA